MKFGVAAATVALMVASGEAQWTCNGSMNQAQQEACEVVAKCTAAINLEGWNCGSVGFKNNPCGKSCVKNGVDVKFQCSSNKLTQFKAVGVDTMEITDGEAFAECLEDFFINSDNNANAVFNINDMENGIFEDMCVERCKDFVCKFHSSIASDAEADGTIADATPFIADGQMSTGFEMCSSALAAPTEAPTTATGTAAPTEDNSTPMPTTAEPTGEPTMMPSKAPLETGQTHAPTIETTLGSRPTGEPTASPSSDAASLVTPLLLAVSMLALLQ